MVNNSLIHTSSCWQGSAHPLEMWARLIPAFIQSDIWFPRRWWWKMQGFLTIWLGPPTHSIGHIQLYWSKPFIRPPPRGRQGGWLCLILLLGENHNNVPERRGPHFSTLDTSVYFYSPHDSQASSYTQNITLLKCTVLLLSCFKQKNCCTWVRQLFLTWKKNDNISILSFSAIWWTRLTI